MQAIHMFGFPPAFKNWHAWLFENGFSMETPNPTNEFVAKFYGREPLWKTPYSMAIPNIIIFAFLVQYGRAYAVIVFVVFVVFKVVLNSLRVWVK